MAGITTIFWDLGGVVLTNGWDVHARRRAAEHYHLDWDHFGERHEMVGADFEEGRVPLDEYLEAVVFHRRRDFSRDDFRRFMFDQSQANPDTLNIVEALADEYRLATLNNESYELNLHRIERFGLRKYFTAFFSSCFLGVRKPDRKIFRVALQITQRAPEECVFIDDGELNVECARRVGLNAIRFEDAEQCRRELLEHGVGRAG